MKRVDGWLDGGRERVNRNIYNKSEGKRVMNERMDELIKYKKKLKFRVLSICLQLNRRYEYVYATCLYLTCSLPSFLLLAHFHPLMPFHATNAFYSPHFYLL